MKKKLVISDLVMTGLIICLTLLMYLISIRQMQANDIPNQKVALNEILQLTKQAQDPEASDSSFTLIEDKITALSSTLDTSSYDRQNASFILIFGILMVVMLQIILCYVYTAILAPFQRMKEYTEELAKGNFDLPLPYNRANYFGAFTWAFDHMRLEVNRARSCEKEAIENNKTTIATLSHDLKTPIASIRAYAEGLEANLVSSAQKREYYIQVILRKCDEVTRLTNDLFYHSLADLDKLTIALTPIHLNSFLKDQVQEFLAGKDDIHLFGCEEDIVILGDQQRLSQILGNLITNSRKYARTKINLTVETSQDEVKLMIRDYGDGILDEDLPFVCDRFYRGKNCNNEPGAGLGLYIVDYLMIQMNGCVELRNLYPGLCVTLTFPIAAS